MFSGIVEEQASVIYIRRSANGARLSVKSALDHSGTSIGDSIAIEGVCLTVVQVDNGVLDFDVAEETLRRSILSELKAGAAVNLERSLALGERLHGHLVFGHVDGTAELVSRCTEGSSEKLLWSIPEGLAPFIVEKGSISLSGVSLTVGGVEERTFSVYIVPHTGAVTTLLARQPGDRVNLEVDMLARYVHSMLHAEAVDRGSLSAERLRECGFVPEHSS